MTTSVEFVVAARVTLISHSTNQILALHARAARLPLSTCPRCPMQVSLQFIVRLYITLVL